MNGFIPLKISFTQAKRVKDLAFLQWQSKKKMLEKKKCRLKSSLVFFFGVFLFLFVYFFKT